MIVLVLFSTFVLYTFDDQKHAGIFHQNSQATARLAAYLALLHYTYFMVGERWNVVFAPGKVRSYTDWLQEGSEQLH